MQLKIGWLLLLLVDVGVGQVALASITEPSGHVCVDGCDGWLLSPGGLLLSLGGDDEDWHDGSSGVALQSTCASALCAGESMAITGAFIVFVIVTFHYLFVTVRWAML